MFHCESMCHEAHVKELTCLWVFLTLFFFFLKYDSIQYTVITISLLDVSASSLDFPLYAGLR